MSRVAEALKVVEPGEEPRRPMIEFLAPSALRSFVPPPGWNLIGDYHVQRGSPFVVAGAPGVGKSRVATAMAVAGAKGLGANWLGLPVHAPFKTMVLQAENGRVRLRDEYAEISDPDFDDYIRVCPPPPFGFALDHPDFAAELTAAVAAFEPDVLMVDPWNRATADDKSKDYLSTFQKFQALLPTGDKAPALGVICHTRKPQNGERANGRALLNILAGGYALGSVPRSAFVLQHASDDPTETRVVWTCCKNNDGQLGERSAWVRGNGLFQPADNFNWKEFDAPPEKRRVVSVEDLEAIFKDEDGKGWRSLSRKEAVGLLENRTSCKNSACYAALDCSGKFGSRLNEKSGFLTLK